MAGQPGRPATEPITLPPSQSSWWKQAACLGHRHPEWFTSACHHPGGNRARGPLTVNAKRAFVVCAGCSRFTRRACLAEALSLIEQVGVWGGLTDKERMLLPHERDLILRERYGSA